MNTIKGLQTPVTAVDATDPESTGSQPPASPSPSTSVTYTAADLKSARRKVDLRLVVWYSFMYLILMIHKGNISNAAIINLESGDGIREELGGLTSSQWAWAISIFYYPYMLAEPAATLALKKFNPNVWMARIMITWGVISMCQGATQNFEGLMACRFFLGLAEAGFYPGVLYHFSFWLPPDSMPLRIAVFYACGKFYGTISGFLAYAIANINNAGGLSGWRWLFIIEGLPSILCCLYTYFFLPNYPQTAKFLTEAERRALLAQLPEDAPTMNAKTINWQQIKELFKDPTWISFCIIWISHGIGGFGITFVLPNIIYDLGIEGTAVTQLMSMPSSTLALIILVSVAYFTHTKRLNTWIAGAVLEVTQIISYIILLTIKHNTVKYVFVLIAAAAGQSFFPIIWPERIRAARGTTSAGLAIGLTNAAGQFQGILGPRVYELKYGPSYSVSFGASVGLLSVTLTALFVSWYLLEKRPQRATEEAQVTDEDEKTAEAGVKI